MSAREFLSGLGTLTENLKPRRSLRAGFRRLRQQHPDISIQQLEARAMLSAVAMDDSYVIEEGATLRTGGYVAIDSLITKYDASLLSGLSDGDPVSVWSDASGNGNTANAIQAGTFAANGVGGRPSVDFNLNDNYQSAQDVGSNYGVQGDAGWTMVWVVNVRSEVAGFPLLSVGGIGSGNGERTAALIELQSTRLDLAGGFGNDVIVEPLNSFAQFFGEEVILTFRHHGDTGMSMLDTSSIFMNGIAPGEFPIGSYTLGATGTAAFDAFQIADLPITLGGGAVVGTVGFDGLISEVQIYNDALSDTELQAVHHALGGKYGIVNGDQTPSVVGLLDNDTNPGSAAPLSAILVSGPSNGTLSLDIDGSIQYSPNPDFTGVDTFTYKVNDGTADSNVAIVSITVGSAGIAPAISSLSATPNPVLQGASFDMTATGVSDADDSVSVVNFYRDTNGNGMLEIGIDTLVDFDSVAAAGWSITTSAAGLATGSHDFFAQAIDASGLASNVVSTTVTVMPAVYWDGGAGNLLWNSPLNWSADVLPNAADDVVINVAGNITVTLSGTNTTIRSLKSSEALNLSSGSLRVTAPSEVQGAFTTGTNTTLTVSGPGAIFLASGPTTLGVSSLIANSGGVIELPNATSYAAATDGDTNLLADGAGSKLLLAGITSLQGVGRNGRVAIKSTTGGVIDLSGLETIPSGTTEVGAKDIGSLIDLSQLLTWTDANQNRSSSVTWGNGGVVKVNSLQTMNSIGVTANTGETLVFPSLMHMGAGSDTTAIVLADGLGSRIEFPVLTTMDGTNRHGATHVRARNGGVIDMSSVVHNLDGTTQISAFDAGSVINLSSLQTWSDGNQFNHSSVTWGLGGVVRVDSLHTISSVGIVSNTGDTLVFPALTAMQGGGDTSALVLADGPNSRIEFPVLTTMDGTNRHGATEIRARNGGVIDMSSVIDNVDGTTVISAFDTGSLIDLSSLQYWLDGNQFGSSSLTWGDGGTVNVNSLQTTINVSLLASGGNVLTFPAMERIGGTTDSASVIRADGPGSRLEFPAVTVADGTRRHGTVAFRAQNGGVVNLPALLEITTGAVIVSADGTDGAGNGSIMNMPLLHTWTHGNIFQSSSLTSEGEGIVHLGSLAVKTDIRGVQVTARGTGRVDGSRLNLLPSTILSGNGIVTADVVNTSGRVQVGNTVGTLTIVGDFENEATGVVAIDIGGTVSGTDSDRLIVTGTAILNGTLQVSLLNGYVPVSGDAIEILHFGSRVCDFLNKTGLNLGNGLYLAAVFDLDLMTLHAGSTPDSGQQCQTIPAFTNVNVGPNPAKAADVLSITFEVDVPLLTTPTVTVDGNAAFMAAQNGSFYTFSYVVAGTETEGSIDIVMTATSLDGGIGQTSVVTMLDFTDPVVTNITPDQVSVEVGSVLTVTFDSSEALSNNTIVRIGGEPATRNNVPGYSYSRLITGDEGLGQVTVEVAAVDIAGNTGVATGQVQIFTNSGPAIVEPDDRGQLITGGTGTNDLVQIVVSLAEAISPAVEADFIAYQVHLDSGLANSTFHLSTLGISMTGFERFERLLQYGTFRRLYENVIVGTNYSESLLGTSAADLIVGQGGNDMILGHGGNDIIIGGNGDDSVDGGDDNDVFLYSGTGNGFDSIAGGAGTDRVVAVASGTVIGVNGYDNGVEEFTGHGDTIIRDTNYSRTLNFNNTTLTGIAEVDAAGGNDTVTASNLSAGVYRGGTGDDVLIAGSTAVTWLYSGSNGGFDTLQNGAGLSVAVAEIAGTVIGVNGYDNGVEEFTGHGDTIIRDTNYSRTLNFSNTILTGIEKWDTTGGNDTVTASNLSAGVYRGGTGDDVLIAGSTAVTWLYSGSNGGFDTLQNGAGLSVVVAETAGTVIGVNGYDNGVEEFTGHGDTIIRDTNYSRTLNFNNTTLTGIAEVDAAGGNDTVTASNLSAGVYRGGTGDDVLIAGSTAVTWLYSGSNGGFDTLQNGAGLSVAVAETAGTVIGVNGYDNGVEEFTGHGDTIIRDTNYSRTLNFSNTTLTGIAEVDAAGGNDTVTASNLSAGVYRGGTGDDVLIAGSTAVTWLYSGSNGGFDTLQNGAGLSVVVAETAGTVIGVNGYDNGVEEFTGHGDTIIRDTNYSRTLNFNNTTLTGIAEVDAAGGNDTVTASNLSAGVYRGGTGDDVLIAGSTAVTWLYSGSNGGFDTLQNGAGLSVAVAETAGTVIGVNGYDNGVEEFTGHGDTIIRDTNYSRTLGFSNTILTGIAEVDAAGGNDTVTASNLSAGVYRGGTGDDVQIAGSTAVTWLYSGSIGGFDTLQNGAGLSVVVAETAGTVIGVNGYDNGVEELTGLGDTIIRDTNYSRTLGFSNTILTGIAEVDAAGGNDTVTASNLSAGVYRGGTGDDVLIAGSTAVTWLYSGSNGGFDTLQNGAGLSVVVAETAGTVIGVNGYDNGVEEFTGLGDTIIRDTNYSRTLDFSNTILTGIAEVDAAGGNDTVTASVLSGAKYRLGSGHDWLVVASANAAVEITVADFNQSGIDHIDLRVLSLPNGFHDLQFAQHGAATEVAAPGLNLRLLDILFTELDEEDFLFS